MVLSRHTHLETWNGGSFLYKLPCCMWTPQPQAHPSSAWDTPIHHVATLSDTITHAHPMYLHFGCTISAGFGTVFFMYCKPMLITELTLKVWRSRTDGVVCSLAAIVSTALDPTWVPSSGSCQPEDANQLCHYFTDTGSNNGMCSSSQKTLISRLMLLRT